MFQEQSTIMQWVQANPILQSGAALMAAGWIGYQIRSLPRQAIGFIRQWTTRVIEIRDRDPLFDAWLAMCTEAAVRRGGPRTLEVRSRLESIDGESDNAIPGLRAGLDQFWARLAGRWCHVSVRKEQPDAKDGHRFAMPSGLIQIEVFGGKRHDIERMLAMAKRRADILERHQIVEICDRWGGTHRQILPKRDVSTLCLPRGLFEEFERRLVDFRASKMAYESVGIPWRLGILLHGEPGTGKTSLVHALASRLSVSLSVISLTDLQGDEELVSAFSSLRSGSMVLLEDVDAAFAAERQGQGRVSFSGLLNCIDGMLAPHNGRILVMSTNHPERLDPALIRPGRIDVRLEMPLLTREMAADYVDRVFPHVAARHDIIETVMGLAKPTAAELINRIMREPWQRKGVPAAKARSSPGLQTVDRPAAASETSSTSV